MTATLTRSPARLRIAKAWTAACLAVGAGLIVTSPFMDGPATEAASVEAPSIEHLMAQDDVLLREAGQFVPDQGLTPDQAREVILAADRVCEGATAEVPVMVMADTVAAEQGLSDTEARAFVHAVLAAHC